MTQTGKCDTCRQRKVKCDEEKPKCNACKKKDRPCSYSYGKASAFVVHDPKQLTKHGKSRVAPVVYTLDSLESHRSPSDSTPPDLYITTEREAENGQGFFQTLAPASKRKLGISRKTIAYRKRKLELYMQHLQAESAITAIKPLSPEATLVARYIHMLGSETANKQPLSILGTWIQSIPSRIGHNGMMDLAVEFLVNSYDVFWDDTHSKRCLAIASKEKALKELQLFVFSAQNNPTYDVLLATKMHYAAEALMGIESMYHAIHAFGLAELLKSGKVANVDDEHFWNLIDNTYIDDVNEAMLAGRKSVYDNDFYLSSTYPPPLSSNLIVLSAFQRASMVIMHVSIQCPRLNALVRHAISHPEDTTALVSATTLAESLWQLNIPDQVSPLLREAITVRPIPPCSELADIMEDALIFNSVQSMILCTRYWMLINILGGLIDTLYRHFPTETALSLLPDRYFIHNIETDAALKIAKSTTWAETVSQKLPLVPLRLHTPLQVSTGPWYRTIRRLNSFRSLSLDLDADVALEMTRTVARAERMKSWIIEKCNDIHAQWDVSTVSEKPLLQALDTMAGERIPDWLPVRVRFEAEDGEMVLKLDYANKAGSYQEQIDLSENSSAKKDWVKAAIEWWKTEKFENADLEELPDRSKSVQDAPEILNRVYRSETMELRTAANFVHSTGRNLCATSGWWPSAETPSTVLLDSTHKVSAFSGTPSPPSSSTKSTVSYVDRHPCLASSFWPQTPKTTTSSLVSAKKSISFSPIWSSPSTGSETRSDDSRRFIDTSSDCKSTALTTSSPNT